MIKHLFIRFILSVLGKPKTMQISVFSSRLCHFCTLNDEGERDGSNSGFFRYQTSRANRDTNQ